MKKTLIVLTLVFVIAVPSYAAVEKTETESFNAQVKTFIDKVFQGEKHEYERRIQTPKVTPSEGTVPSKQERSVPGIEVEVAPGVPSEVRETDSAGREITLPYCESADIDKHYALANDYVEENVSPKYSINQESHRQVGPCNQGNTAWTAFNAVDGGNNIVGEVIVNGDTEEVSFASWSGDGVTPSSSLKNSDYRALKEDNKEKSERENDKTNRADDEEELEAGNMNIGNRIKSFINNTILRKGTSSPSENRSAGPGDFSPADEANVPQEIRQMIEQKRIEVREKIRENRKEIQTIRNEAEEKFQLRKQDFEERVKQIQDMNKREIANRIYNKMFDIQNRNSERFNNTLDKLDTILTNITTRADKAEIDDEVLRSAVEEAKNATRDARENIKEILQKEYSPEGSDIETLRQEFKSIRDELKNDLENVRSMVRNTHELTRSAAERLTQIVGSE